MRFIVLVVLCSTFVSHASRMPSSIWRALATPSLLPALGRGKLISSKNRLISFSRSLLSVHNPVGPHARLDTWKRKRNMRRLCCRLSTSRMCAGADEAPPVTLLAGFLGAGKTTSLEHMLANRAGIRIAVMVNDVASVNVDAATIRRRTIEVDGVETVELKNGCVCCGTGAGELAPALRSLMNRCLQDRDANFDHIVLELSGVADPKNVKEILHLASINIAHKVALVDANAFPALYNSRSIVGERADLAGAVQTEACDVLKKVVDLLLSQVESADVILVNKCDLASIDELETTLRVCRALNPSATIVKTTYGDAPLKNMLPIDQADSTIANEASQAKTVSDSSKPSDHHGRGSVPHSADSIDFQTYVYRARKPFSRQRLIELLRAWPLPRKDVLSMADITALGGNDTQIKNPAFARILRSKGIVWLSDEHSIFAEWSLAGRHMSLKAGGRWWATFPSEIMRAALSKSGTNTTETSDAYLAELAAFGDRYGDRRQEIVFIGTDLDANALKQAFDACLLSGRELQEYRERWKKEDEMIADANGPFRFAIGTRVECNMGDVWKKGKIIKQYYREKDWPLHEWRPYQVELDEGDSIPVLMDKDTVCRQI